MNISSKFNLSNDIAVVTGGAGLLGLKHCEALLEAESKVIIMDLDKKALAKAADIFTDKYNGQFLALDVDVTKEKQIILAKEKIYKKFNSYPTILINNAAIDTKYETDNIVNKTRLEEFDLEQWNIEISVGLSGAFLCCKHFGIEMSKKSRGVILNISSDLGLIAPSQFLYEDKQLSNENQSVKPITYSVIKHGLIGLTRYMSTYWAKNGVRCNALAPGGVYNEHDKNFVNKLSNLIPIGRMARIDEYKSTIVFMCSDASSYMNGAVLVMDGGRTTW
ncbi:MAG: oxidoreductase [Gammaproteobacteria bacterium]|nr:oxidoreductase [Gammaproteobacteria bacterium]|tara:strand:+ start:266 stop:1096 length:831 start_codon:yes stop_codon:yes gene_type:complete